MCWVGGSAKKIKRNIKPLINLFVAFVKFITQLLLTDALLVSLDKAGGSILISPTYVEGIVSP